MIPPGDFSATVSNAEEIVVAILAKSTPSFDLLVCQQRFAFLVKMTSVRILSRIHLHHGFFDQP